MQTNNIKYTHTYRNSLGRKLKCKIVNSHPDRWLNSKFKYALIRFIGRRTVVVENENKCILYIMKRKLTRIKNN